MFVRGRTIVKQYLRSAQTPQLLGDRPAVPFLLWLRQLMLLLLLSLLLPLQRQVTLLQPMAKKQLWSQLLLLLPLLLPLLLRTM